MNLTRILEERVREKQEFQTHTVLSNFAIDPIQQELSLRVCWHISNQTCYCEFNKNLRRKRERKKRIPKLADMSSTILTYFHAEYKIF